MDAASVRDAPPPRCCASPEVPDLAARQGRRAPSQLPPFPHRATAQVTRSSFPPRPLLLVEPLRERLADQPRPRAGQQAAGRLHLGVGVAWVAGALDLGRGSRAGRRGRSPASPGPPPAGRPARSSRRLRRWGRPRPRRPRRRSPRPPPGPRRSASASPTPWRRPRGAPVEQLRDELVELRGPDDEDRDRPASQAALVLDLGRAVPAGEQVAFVHADHLPRPGVVTTMTRPGPER